MAGVFDDAGGSSGAPTTGIGDYRSSFADSYVEGFEPWINSALETYLRAIASMFSEVELLAFDTNDYEGWTILFDPDRAPLKALPYLAQYVGERLPLGLTEAQMREWIKDAPNQRRGTLGSLFLATQRNLTGTRMVAIRERDGSGATDDPNYITVQTYSEETPDPAATLRDIISVLPADLILNYADVGGQSWEDVMEGYTTWEDVRVAYATWADLAEENVGAVSFTRPMP